MKRRLVLPAMVLALPVVAGCARPPAQSGPATLGRACVVAASADAAGDDEIARLQRDLRQQRHAARAAEHLGYRFVSRARLTADAGFYTIAEQAAACLESMQPDDPAALLLRGHVLHQMHRFGEAEAIARRLVTSREFVLDFGLLGDALMEQGRVAEAAVAYQRMIDLKPFYQSYTRAAHLRWLKGDLAGAIELMQKAVKAASPRDPESLAWAYTRLALLELQRGRLRDAGRLAGAALRVVPEYAPALLARGRIELAADRAVDAARTLERAVGISPQPEYRWVFADALRVLNRTEEALTVERELVRDSVSEDPRTLALYLSTRREDVRTAVALARQELERRSDVFTLDALAWALACAGQTREASALMDRALAEGTEDGRLFVHASIIAAADGRHADAARWARQARMLRFTLLPSELAVLRTGLARTPSARGTRS